MKAISIIILLSCLLFLSSGCAFRSPVIPPTGVAFSNYEAPVDITYRGTEIGDKQGRAKSVSVIGLLAFGNCTADKAAQKGNIKRIDHIGYHYTNILGIVTSYETIVYGE